MFLLQRVNPHHWHWHTSRRVWPWYPGLERTDPVLEVIRQTMSRLSLPAYSLLGTCLSFPIQTHSGTNNSPPPGPPFSSNSQIPLYSHPKRRFCFSLFLSYALSTFQHHRSLPQNFVLQKSRWYGDRRVAVKVQIAQPGLPRAVQRLLIMTTAITHIPL